MPGGPPSKDDNYSPPGRPTGRSNNPTPSSSAQRDEQQRSLLRDIMSRRGERSLEQVAGQPGMPERADYPSHEAWLRALLAASLRQSDTAHDYFHREGGSGGDSSGGAGDSAGGSHGQDPNESKEGSA